MRTCDEWSREFDLLYDNITSHQAPGLESYEKSVFLTRAQEKVVLSLCTGMTGKAFESTEDVTVYLAPLVSQVTKTTESSDEGIIKATSKSYVYDLPPEFLFRTLESCIIDAGGSCGEVEAEVIPVTQDELHRTIRNPFKNAGKRRVLRLAYAKTTLGPSDTAGVNDKATVKNYSELISEYSIVSYTVRYIRKPKPIILDVDTDGKKIDDKNERIPCELNEALHQAILTEAVQMAKAAWLS